MNFEYLCDAVGKMIQIERGGPDKLQGRLLAVKVDHLIVETADSIVYVSSRHIKTVSEPILTEMIIDDPGDGQEDAPLPIIIDTENLRDLLTKLTHKLVKINQNSPNALEGVLLTVREDAVTILHKMQDYVHYPLLHIKTIIWVINAPVKEENKKDDKKDNEKDN